ncbi:MAG: ECF transporter S component [Clostridia bacterium]
MNFLKQNWKRLATWSIVGVIIPLVVILGAVLFAGKKYNIISIIIAVLACAPFFIAYERGEQKIREMVIVAVMIALSVAGRCIFAFIPGFKPVTAVVIVAGIFLGKEAGFLTGALSAVISNLIFGQGPWTPFQMLVWGLIGFVCGLFGRRLNKWWWLILVGAVSGVAFSMVMDLWTALSIDGGFVWQRYVASLVVSLPWMAVYVISNCVFLLALVSPIGKRLERLKQKYGIFENKKDTTSRRNAIDESSGNNSISAIDESSGNDTTSVSDEGVENNKTNAIDKNGKTIASSVKEQDDKYFEQLKNIFSNK